MDWKEQVGATNLTIAVTMILGHLEPLVNEILSLNNRKSRYASMTIIRLSKLLSNIVNSRCTLCIL